MGGSGTVGVIYLQESWVSVCVRECSTAAGIGDDRKIPCTSHQGHRLTDRATGWTDISIHIIHFLPDIYCGPESWNIDKPSYRYLLQTGILEHRQTELQISTADRNPGT